jgi:hypothetical protein
MTGDLSLPVAAGEDGRTGGAGNSASCIYAARVPGVVRGSGGGDG